MAQVLHEFPSVPLPICAEALRRGESQAAACMLLKDFEDQVCSVVTSLAKRVVSSKGMENMAILPQEECQEISRLALDSTGWNPDQAFNLAEGHALSLIQVRREIAMLQQRGRNQALAAVQAEGEPGEVATALSALDATNNLQDLPAAVLLAQLQDCDMKPAEAARQLWAQQTGQFDGPDGYEGPPRPPPAPPPPRVPKQDTKGMSRLSPRKRRDRKGKDGEKCVSM
eukprot:symbB.v1.2.012346.t1/scaffold826.1/size159518/13